MTDRIDFKKLVAEMRRAQKKYFSTRSSHDLAESKRLEKEVDIFLKRYGDNLQKEENKLAAALFPDEFKQ